MSDFPGSIPELVRFPDTAVGCPDVVQFPPVLVQLSAPGHVFEG
jgi:hypothetical protein